MKLVGILNVTPDSFSDGGLYLSLDDALSKAKELRMEGAALIDIGADSTRPGSGCAGAEEEWQRIKDILPAVARFAPVSVDTHNPDVAERAVLAGARMINDVSGGFDREIFKIAAGHGVKLIIMFSSCRRPHDYTHLKEAAEKERGDIISKITEFFAVKVEEAKRAGVKDEQIILDPGMGAFVSGDASVSWDLIRHFEEFSRLGFPLMLGSSRKGFLKRKKEKDIIERDMLSVLSVAVAGSRLDFKGPEYIRIHNVGLHREILTGIQPDLIDTDF